MKIFKDITIKKRLLYLSLGLFLNLTIILLLVLFFFRRISDYTEYMNKIRQLHINTLQLRRSEKDFLLRETSNSVFFATGESKYLKKFEGYFEANHQLLNQLSDSKLTDKLFFGAKITDLEAYIQSYRKNFFTLVEYIRKRGYQAFGLIGNMNEQAEEMERFLHHETNDPLFRENFMMLRYIEQNYLIHSDEESISGFDDVCEKIMSIAGEEVAGSGFTGVNELQTMIKEYRNSFDQIIKHDIVIGLTEEEGLRGKLRDAVHLFENAVSDMTNISRVGTSRAINRAIVTLLLAIVLLAFTFMVLMYLASKAIVNPLKKIKHIIDQLSGGDINIGTWPYSVNDELGEIFGSVKKVTGGLNDKYSFAQKIGRGDFTATLNLQSSKDLLGNAMQSMRDSLKKSKDEADRRKEEENRQMWISNGLAKMNEIIQNNIESLEELAYQVVSNIVKHTGASQGGLFLLNEEDEDNKYLVMAGCIAYDRRKFIQKEIKIGEGLVGACFQEKEKIYITNVPEEYSEISSGMGGAKPGTLLLVPVKHNDAALGVMEIASLYALESYQIKYIEQVAENLGNTVSTVKINSQTKELLKQSQIQAEDLRSKEEEIKQNMEEMQATQEMAANRERELQYKLEEANAEIDKLKRMLPI